MEKCSTWNINAAAENDDLCVHNNRSIKSCSEQIYGKKDCFSFSNVIYESLYWKYSFLAPVGCLIKKVISAQSLDKRFQLCIAAERHLKLSARFSGFLIGGT